MRVRNQTPLTGSSTGAAYASALQRSLQSLASLLLACGVTRNDASNEFSASDERAIRAALVRLGLPAVQRVDAVDSGDSGDSADLWAALHTACVCGNATAFDAVRTLIAHRIVEVDARGPDGDSLLHSLARCGIDRIDGMALSREKFMSLQARVAVLIGLGARVDLPDPHGRVALELAWERDSHAGDQLGEALLGAGCNPARVDQNGWTMLDRAASSGDVSTLRGWCRGQTDPQAWHSEERIADVRCQRQDETLLMLATAVGQTACMRQLIDYDANVNALDLNGMSALHLAVHAESIEAIGLLLDHGADPLCRSTDDRVPFQTSPLAYAARQAALVGDDRMLHRLLAAGGDPDWRLEGQMSAREVFDYAAHGRVWPGG